MADMSPVTRTAVETLSVGTVIGTLAGWLPAMAALLSIVWYGIRIYETKTVQRWLGRSPAAEAPGD